MRQRWHDLLFAHWPLEPASVRATLPPGLELETFGGSAWIGVVPFRMSGVRLRAAPPLPGLSRFPELNLRTYVRAGGKPGVWFYSLDAASALAVFAARRWFHLPYFRARIECVEREGTIRYRHERTHRGAAAAALEASYRPCSAPRLAARGSLEHFLTERYCLYAWSSRAQLLRAEIDHAPWELQDAEAELGRNTLAVAAGLALGAQEPLVHFARLQVVRVWAPRPVSNA